MAASYHEQPGKVKPKFLCFQHFFAPLFVQNVHTNPLQSCASPKDFVVRAKRSQLPLIKTLRALTIGRESPFIPNKYARRRNLQARAQPHFRANAASQSRALKNLDFSCVPEYYSG